MLDNGQLKEILLSQDYLKDDDLKKAEKTAAAYGLSLADALLDEEIISEELLSQAIAEHYGAPWLDMKKEKFDPELLEAIPETVARFYRVIPVSVKGGRAVLAMVDPSDIAAAHMAEKRLGERIKTYYINERQFEEALQFYAGSLKEEFDRIARELKAGKKADSKGDAVMKVVDLLIEKGYRAKASDIHIEPFQKKIEVRFRIDGVMHRMLEMDKALAEAIVSRLKVMARLRTDEHRSSQDGKIRFKIDGRNLDIRMSTVPITEGENVVLRLLSGKNHNLTLTNLGFGSANLKLVKKAIKSPHGMILVTGPTGSGKTTTLYAVLKILNKVEVHIASIEDPVEYAIEGVSQIQVDSRTNLTFAAGLRSILRQDPDIIMVGEIRDNETAGIAVNSALTGHLVLSSLHTNDAPTALPRLLDMGIEPFLAASTVNLVIAQRLVRKNCSKCRASGIINEEEKRLIATDKEALNYLKSKGHKDIAKLTVYRGAGCKVCDFTGYQGRSGVFEVLLMDEEIRHLVMAKRDSGEIMSLARQQGMKTMLEDGLDKALAGETSLEEVLRVLRS